MNHPWIMAATIVVTDPEKAAEWCRLNLGTDVPEIKSPTARCYIRAQGSGDASYLTQLEQFQPRNGGDVFTLENRGHLTVSVSSEDHLIQWAQHCVRNADAAWHPSSMRAAEVPAGNPAKDYRNHKDPIIVNGAIKGVYLMIIVPGDLIIQVLHLKNRIG